MVTTTPARRTTGPEGRPAASRMLVALTAIIALVAVGLMSLFATPASASTLTRPQNAVGVIAHQAGQRVGAHEDIPAGQGRARAPNYDQTVVGSCVGAETGSELSPAVIGEGMKSRVVPFAEANGYETYAGLANPENYTSEELLAHNSAQIETWMNEGRTIYDVGPEPGRAFYPMETSPNYGMEHNLVRGYGGYQPVTLPGEANWWELLDVP